MNHDTRHFAEELAELKQRLLAMGALAEDRLHTAVQAMVERDRGLLAAIITGDEAVNRLHLEIDDRCFKLIALRQPMAVDLRAIVAAFKINSDLERIGDLAVNVAEAAERYLSHSPVKPLIDLPRMGEMAERMLREALQAFVGRRRRRRQERACPGRWPGCLEESDFPRVADLHVRRSADD
jgi:phosphate transport system protein